MTGDITHDPLARSVLRHLAATRGKDDALGSLARTVLSGEASLRAAADNSWHSEALAAAAQAAQDEQSRMSPEQRADIEQAAHRLRRESAADADGGDS
ncbi:hypothetical protein [Couchioplanes azureus]|uniref:hypothetical protein n=1 Tax=Couchioplanes caeruleus TaxID=56438 RepID=UPI0016709C59|nr:hypothetical protein [Couchioplanes caeruleus]GGQ87381.1 hypothetical protein GCM10010166_67010 [Couchioplanes caeruleus subsp. azureus]